MYTLSKKFRLHIDHTSYCNPLSVIRNACKKKVCYNCYMALKLHMYQYRYLNLAFAIWFIQYRISIRNFFNFSDSSVSWPQIKQTNISTYFSIMKLRRMSTAIHSYEVRRFKNQKSVPTFFEITSKVHLKFKIELKSFNKTCRG